MNLKSQPVAYQEAYAMFEFYRRLGFMPDELYFVMDESGQCGIELHTQGKVFTTIVGDIPNTSTDDIKAGWLAVVSGLAGGDISDEEMDEVWYKSATRRDMVVLTDKLTESGIEIPMFGRMKQATMPEVDPDTLN